MLTAIRSLKVGELEDGDGSVGLTQCGHPTARTPGGSRDRGRRDPAALHGVASLLPGSPPSLERRHVGQALFDGDERRTGALVLGPSGTVKDDLRLAGKFGNALGNLV